MRTSGGKTAGAAMVWVLVVCVTLAIVLLLVWGRKPAPRRAVAETPPPTVEEQESELIEQSQPPERAEIVEQLVEESPLVEPSVEEPIEEAAEKAAPEPVPPPDIAELARQPAKWPKQVRLRQSTSFPLSVGGRIAGSVTAPAGTEVQVVSLSSDQVEVEYLRNRQLVPIAATDFEQRILSSPESTQTTAALNSPAPAQPAPERSPSAAGAAAPTTPDRLDKILNVEVLRSRKRRIEGGDYDDKIDRIRLRVKLNNTSPTQPVTGLQGKVYVFAESILSRGSHKLLGIDGFECSLKPRETHEFETAEVQTGFDTTRARWGFKYSGWIFALYDSEGKLAIIKSTLPQWEKRGDRLAQLEKEKVYDRDLNERAAPPL